MAILTKQQILDVNDLVKEVVPVPEWGGEVIVRGMTGADRDKFEASIVSVKGQRTNVNMTDIRARLAAYSICDEEGNRLFTEADVKELSKKSAHALQRVFAVAQKLSGIGESDIKELTDGLQENPLEDSASG